MALETSEPHDWIEARLRLLSAELDAARILLLDAFAHREDADLVQQNRQQVRQSYETITRYLPRLPLCERDAWEFRCVALRAELRDLGEDFV
jgi:hypothetical protein